MKSKLLSIIIVISAVAIISFSGLAIGQRGDSPPTAPVSEGDQLMGPQQEIERDVLQMREIIDQEYSYEQRDELRQRVSSKVDQLNDRINQIDSQVEEMRNLRNEMEKSLIHMEYADENNWNQVQNDVRETAREVLDVPALQTTQ